MTSIQCLWLFIGISWASIEIYIAAKTRVKFTLTSRLEFRSERVIWLVVMVALSLALLLKQQHFLPLPLSVSTRQIVAISLLFAGIGLRSYAVMSLGKLFSTTVITQNEHDLIDTGPYRYIRHPAYTGLLLSFFAAGIAMGDALAMLVLFAPIAFVLQQRITIEEQWLSAHFGKRYDNYCLRTKRLIPRIY